MVKRQKEKQYQSAREHKSYTQLRSGAGGGSTGAVQRTLPFHCCALTLTPFIDPVSIPSSVGTNTATAIVFDNAALLEFLMKHKQNPVTGQSMTSKQVITLHMDKDDEGRWQCPILTKPFADHTKIVAVLDRSSKNSNEAYVYSYEAYKELNVKPKNWLDLTTGKKFSPKTDVLILNDPSNHDFQKRRDISTFWHIQQGRSLQAISSKKATNVKHSVTATRIMEKISKEQQQRNDNKRKEKQQATSASSKKKLKIFSDTVTGVQYTSGKASGSLTSTAMDVTSENTIREASQEEILQEQFAIMRKQSQKKGYVRLMTNHGDLMLELDCDIVPRTCTNFLGLAAQQKYDGTKFHRLIPNFMIQGGGVVSSKQEESIEEETSFWGAPFKDEFDGRLKHVGSGVLSMANAGPNTNKRQFFITFKSCPHLDRKHSVFGRVVDDESCQKTIRKLQAMPTDKKDRPLQPITIVCMEILVDPARDAKQAQEQQWKEQELEKQQSETRKQTMALGKSGAKTTHNGKSIKIGTTNRIQIGKYLPKSVLQANDNYGEDADDYANNNGDGNKPSNSLPSKTHLALPPVVKMKPKAPVPTKQKFGDFAGW